MATASITRNQAQQLYQYLVDHKQTVFTFAKDHGAYFCGRPVDDPKRPGKTINCVQYLKGMNPNESNQDWYDNARDRFGGDDFGEQIPREWLELFLTDSALSHRKSFIIQINDDNIRLCQ